MKEEVESQSEPVESMFTFSCVSAGGYHEAKCSGARPIASWAYISASGAHLCRCPGVFKTAQQGCGAALVAVSRSVPSASGQGAPEVVEFWGCSTWPQCDFREVLPRRLASPQFTLEAAGSWGFRVRAAGQIGFRKKSDGEKLTPNASTCGCNAWRLHVGARCGQASRLVGTRMCFMHPEGSKGWCFWGTHMCFMHPEVSKRWYIWEPIGHRVAKAVHEGFRVSAGPTRVRMSQMRSVVSWRGATCLAWHACVQPLSRSAVWPQVLPAPGAEQVIDFCGGIAAVLRAVGPDMHQAAAGKLQVQADGASENAAADRRAGLCNWNLRNLSVMVVFVPLSLHDHHLVYGWPSARSLCAPQLLGSRLPNSNELQTPMSWCTTLCRSPPDGGCMSRVGHAKPGVCFPWEAYEGVIRALRHKAYHGLDLLGRAALIPDVTLAANRSA